MSWTGGGVGDCQRQGFLRGVRVYSSLEIFEIMTLKNTIFNSLRDTKRIPNECVRFFREYCITNKAK